ncbi:MAG TPA: asparagine synthase (glutamine-hydrolyzing) [Thermoanaerobaculia bacterium]|nr:asparagine synthase (glutamine-hydrolyzing) [Thermoanaerobaculia bacterium]
MCGINGGFAFSSSSPDIDLAEIGRVRDRMASRGPDGEGLWLSDDRRIGLGHRRLGIIDPSPLGAQPMWTRNRFHVIVFNGEIYNHEELREELRAKGKQFKSRSDTEVILAMWEQSREGMLDRLRGMYGLAIWSLRDRRLFVARDPYGIKPLYYSNEGGVFRFASRVKALVEAGVVSAERDPAGVVGFLLRGCVPQPFTTFRSVRALPAGSYLTVDEAGISGPHRHFSVARVFRDAYLKSKPPSDEERRATITAAVRDSIRVHLRSDVPVGAFLSAGRDSSTIVAVASEMLSTPLHTVTLAFDEYRGSHKDESLIAEAVSRRYGAIHHTRTFTRNEFESELPRFIAAMDQPTVDATNSFLVSKAAAEIGLKVALSGTGGDELFGGYTSFRRIPRSVRNFGWARHIPVVGRTFRSLYLQLIPQRRGISRKAAGMFELGGTYAGAYLLKRGLFLPWEIAGLVGEELAVEGLARLNMLPRITEEIEPDPMTPFGRVAALESSLYLRDQLLNDIDWASMAHSLEVRVPFVDVDLLRRVAPVVCRGMTHTKDDLTASPSQQLPDEVLNRPKSGFNIPVRQWLWQSDPGARSVNGMRGWAMRVLRAFYNGDVSAALSEKRPVIASP